MSYLPGYVCVQWSRLFQSWSRLVSSSQIVPPKILHCLTGAYCSPTGSEQLQPPDCGPPRPRRCRHTGRPHVHGVLARCCRSGLCIHRWGSGCCRLAPRARWVQWTVRYEAHTVWGSGPFRGYRQGCLHRVSDRGVLRLGC